jgi:hypothetical protein
MLKRFAKKILRKAPSSLLLLPQPTVEAQPKLSTHSRRIDAQPLSGVSASKRGEVMMMKRTGFLDGQTRPSTAVVDAYDSIFVDQLNPLHAEAIRELFLDPQGERPRHRARQCL